MSVIGENWEEDRQNLWWGLFEDQWEQFGFTQDEAWAMYGDLFPGFRTGDEVEGLLDALDITLENEAIALSLLGSQEERRLEANEANRQNISLFQTSKLDTADYGSQVIGDLQEKGIRENAKASLEGLTKALGRRGLSSGDGMSTADLALDTVKSKLNQSNSSQNFSRTKNVIAREELKNTIGAYVDGEWQQGSQGLIDQLKSDNMYNLETVKLGNFADLQRYNTEMKIQSIYDAWQEEILGNVGELFGILGSPCEEGETWSNAQSACIPIEANTSPSEDGPGQDDDLDNQGDDPVDTGIGEGGGGDEFDSFDDEDTEGGWGEDLEYEDWDPDSYGDGYS